MSAALAFFPWVFTDEIKEFGSVRILPYRKGELPRDLPSVTQTDIDGVLGSYANRPNRYVEKAALVEFGDWQVGMDSSPDIVCQLFRVRDLIAMAALSHRTLFRQHFRYCNFHTYTLVVQRYLPNETGTIAFNTRRRDGSTNQLWGTDEFAFHRPIHVAENSRMALDEPLLRALLNLPEAHPFHEAIVEFNSANTDSTDVPEHVELVMCKSAMERLLGINSEKIAFVRGIHGLIAGIDSIAASGPMTEKWKDRWPGAERPLIAWAREFCATRGASAHGMARNQGNFVWGDHQHLAFVAVLFPLLLKLKLSKENLFALDAYDVEQIRRIDEYLAFDPFNFNWENSEEIHPWSSVEHRCRCAVIANAIVEQFNHEATVAVEKTEDGDDCKQ